MFVSDEATKTVGVRLNPTTSQYDIIVPPLRMRHIIFGVFVGNLLAAIVGVIFFELFIHS
jgi:hypothetical protein